ncbi:MAG: ADP-ribosyltransferase-containing protein, partial [Candidatus Aquicultor sp.]
QTPTKPTSLINTQKEKVKKEIDSDLQDFMDSLGVSNDTDIVSEEKAEFSKQLTSEQLAKGTKLVTSRIENGLYKFDEIVKELESKIGNNVKMLIDPLKQAYGAYAAAASDEIADKMDELKTVRKYQYGETKPKKSREKTDFIDRITKEILNDQNVKDTVEYGDEQNSLISIEQKIKKFATNITLDRELEDPREYVEDYNELLNDKTNVPKLAKELYNKTIENQKASRPVKKEKETTEKVVNPPINTTDKTKPKYQVGTRVKILDATWDNIKGRTGEIIKADTSTHTTWMYGQGESPKEYQHHYDVKTDNGLIHMASEKEIEPIETPEDKNAVPDILIKEKNKWTKDFQKEEYVTPEVLVRKIKYAKEEETKFRERANRARKPDVIKTHTKEADLNKENYEYFETELDKWIEKYPQEAERLHITLGKMKVPVTPNIHIVSMPTVTNATSSVTNVTNKGITVRKNEAQNGVEIKFDSKPHPDVINKLKHNGFRWSVRNHVWYSKFSDSKMKWAQTEFGGGGTEKLDDGHTLMQPSDKSADERISRDFGASAFKEGLKRVPALDTEFMGYLESHHLKIGEGGSQLLDAWLKGWDDANSVKPVEERIRESAGDITHDQKFSKPAETQIVKSKAPATTYGKNFEAIQKVIPGLLDMKAGDVTKLYADGDKDSYDDETGGMMPLSVDVLSNGPRFMNIAIAHNYIQNGDVMADPDMELKIDKENGFIEALHFQQDNMGIYREVYPSGGQVNLKEKNDQNKFLTQWLKNLEEQKYSKADDSLTTAEENGKLNTNEEAENGTQSSINSPNGEGLLADDGPEKVQGTNGGGKSPKRSGSIRKDDDERGEETDTGTGTNGGRASGTSGVGEGERGLSTNVGNFKHTTKTLKEFESLFGSPTDKYKANITAIELLKKITSEKRPATFEEQAILSRYTGWGGLKSVFTEKDKRHSEVKNLLTPEQYKFARASILNAHYTAPDIVKGIYSLVKHLGFSSGNMVEPSMGSGLFFSLMPDDVKPTKLLGIELDEISAGISKLLYPDTNIEHKGFQEVYLPKDSVDLFISNVPYGQNQVIDKIDKNKYYGKVRLSVHNFFFAKSIEKTKPGGLIVYLTSRYTMDSVDKNFREFMAKDAELIGAIRLPSSTFKGIANTEVVADLIVLRKKRGENANKNVAWMKTVPLEYDNNKNEYFVEHPEMIIGKEEMVGSMNKENDYTVTLPYDQIVKKLQEAIQKFPKNVVGLDSKGLDGELDNLLDGMDLDVFGEEKIEFGQMKPEDKFTKIIATFADGGIVKFADIVAKLREKVGDKVDGMTKQLKEAYDNYYKPKPENSTDVSNIKNKGFVLVDFKPYQRIGDDLVEVKVSKDDFIRLRDFIELKENYNRLIELETSEPDGSALLENIRKATDRAYDRFVMKHKHLHSSKNYKLLDTDPDFYKLLGVENVVKEKGIITGHTKAEILKHRVLASNERPKVAKDAKDALLISLNELNEVNIPRIAELLNSDEKSVINELKKESLIYKFHEEYLTADDYLSGDVVSKLEEAKELAKTNHDYDVNVAALKANQPERKYYMDFSSYIRLGLSYVPDQVYMDFFKEVFGGKVKVKFSQGSGKFLVTERNSSNTKISNEFAVRGDDAYTFFDHAFSGTFPKYWDKMRDGSSELDVDSTNQAAMLIKQMHQLFKGYIDGNEAAQKSIEEHFNSKFNRMRSRGYDGTHLTFPGLAKKLNGRDFELYPHQKNGVYRVLQPRNSLLAHTMGAGKTATIIIATMESKRLGLKKKTIISVPKSVLSQFPHEFAELYPNARILSPTENDFKPKGRKEFIAKIRSGDWDAVIISHGNLKMIPLSNEAMANFYRSAMEEFDEVIDELEAESDGSRSALQEIKRMLKQKENYEAKLTQIANASKTEDVLNFDDLGVDQLIVDEAHLFKNLYLPTKHGSVKGIGKSISGRAVDLATKTDFIRKKFGYGIVFSTGTPVANALTEFVVMQRYLQPETLKDLGVYNLDSWLATYGAINNDIEVSVAGKVKEQTRLRNIENLRQLMPIYTEIADIVTESDLAKVAKVPKLKDGKRTVIELPMSEDYINFVRALAYRAENLPKDKREDNMLKISGEGRRASVDMRLVGGKDLPGSKINTTVEVVYDYWNETKAEKSTQLIRLDMGTPGGAGFDLYSDIRRKLVAKGVPKEEIKFIHEFPKTADRERLFNMVNNGTVRVVIGSTDLVGIGVNMQRLLGKLWHVDFPYRPDQLLQAEKRILRPGNTHDEVEIGVLLNKAGNGEQVYPFDAYQWQLLQNKEIAYEGSMNKNPNVDTIDDSSAEALSMAELKALATNNLGLMELVRLRGERSFQESLYRQYLKKRANDQDILAHIPNRIKMDEEQLISYKKDVKNFAEKAEDVTITLWENGNKDKAKDYKEEQKKEFVEDVKKLFESLNWVGSDRNIPIGEINGKFTLMANRSVTTSHGSEGFFDQVRYDAHIVSKETGDSFYAYKLSNDIPGLNFTKFVVVGQGLQEKIAEIPGEIEKLKKQAMDLEKILSRPFENEKKLSEIQERLRELETSIGARDNKEVAEDPNEGKDEDEDEETDFIAEEKAEFGEQKQTDTAEFKKWFGDSKVVDENGKPLKVYHGTRAKFSEFDKEKSGGLIFFTNGQKAAGVYAKTSLGRGKKEILPVYLRMENPRTIDYKQSGDNSIHEDAEEAESEGYDGLIALNSDDGRMIIDQYVVFNPNQIKSAIGNDGSFDPNDPSILSENKPSFDRNELQKLQDYQRHLQLALKQYPPGSPEALKVIRELGKINKDLDKYTEGGDLSLFGKDLSLFGGDVILDRNKKEMENKFGKHNADDTRSKIENDFRNEKLESVPEGNGADVSQDSIGPQEGIDTPRNGGKGISKGSVLLSEVTLPTGNIERTDPVGVPKSEKAKTVRDEWKETGSVSFSGRQLSSDYIQDIGDLYHINRNPFTESFTFQGLDDNNRIVGTVIINSNASDHVIVGNSDVLKALKYLHDKGTTKIFPIHNHPSGIVDPSTNDFERVEGIDRLTKLFAKTYKANIKVDSAVIINGDKFSHWKPGGTSAQYKPYINPTIHPNQEWYDKHFNVDSPRARTFEDAANLAAGLKYGDGMALVMSYDSQLRLRGSELVPVSELEKSPESVVRTIEGILKRTGGSGVVFVKDAADVKNIPGGAIPELHSQYSKKIYYLTIETDKNNPPIRPKQIDEYIPKWDRGESDVTVSEEKEKFDTTGGMLKTLVVSESEVQVVSENILNFAKNHEAGKRLGLYKGVSSRARESYLNLAYNELLTAPVWFFDKHPELVKIWNVIDKNFVRDINEDIAELTEDLWKKGEPYRKLPKAEKDLVLNAFDKYIQDLYDQRKYTGYSSRMSYDQFNQQYGLRNEAKDFMLNVYKPMREKMIDLLEEKDFYLIVNTNINKNPFLEGIEEIKGSQNKKDFIENAKEEFFNADPDAEDIFNQMLANQTDKNNLDEVQALNDAWAANVVLRQNIGAELVEKKYEPWRNKVEIPTSRLDHKFYVGAYMPISEMDQLVYGIKIPTEKYFGTAEDEVGAEKIKKMLLDKGFEEDKISVGNFKKLRENILDNSLTEEDVIDLFNNTNVDLNSDIAQKLLKNIQAKGFERHFIPKQYIPGFKFTNENFEKTIYRHINGLPNYTHKIIGMNEMQKEMGRLKEKGILKDGSNEDKYIKHLRNQMDATGVDGLSAVRAAASTIYLSLRPAYLVQQILQPFNTTIPYLPVIEKELRIPKGSAEKAFADSLAVAPYYYIWKTINKLYDVIGHKLDSSFGLEPEFIDIMKRMERQGVAKPLRSMEMLGEQVDPKKHYSKNLYSGYDIGKFNVGVYPLLKLVSIPGVMAEDLTRTVGIRALYLMGKKAGLSGSKFEQFISTSIAKMYGPPSGRQSKPPGYNVVSKMGFNNDNFATKFSRSVLSSMTIFKNFAFMNYGQWGRLWRDLRKNESARGFVYAAAGGVGLSGLRMLMWVSTALLFLKGIYALFDIPQEPEEDMKNLLKNADKVLPGAGDALYKGLGYANGIDLSNLFSQQAPFISEDIAFKGDVGSAVGGVPVAVAKDAVKAFSELDPM